MQLAFTLSMPGCPSWNGKWSGEGRKYVIVVPVGKGKWEKCAAQGIVDHGPYSYRWDDGWMARIDVHLVDAKQAARLRKESNGFCGYDWMVDTIIKYGKPMATHEVELHLAEAWGIAMAPDN